MHLSKLILSRSLVAAGEGLQHAIDVNEHCPPGTQQNEEPVREKQAHYNLGFVLVFSPVVRR